MDKTEDTKGLSSETPGQASKGSEGITSEKEAKTYTQNQVDKAVSDALSTAGRGAKALEQRENVVKAREDTNKAEQERRDAAELAEAQKDPDQLAVYQARKAEEKRAKSLDEREADLARDKAEHEAEITAAKETQLEIELWKIAEAEGVDPVELKDMMKDLNLTTVEQAKTAAKRLNKKPVDETTKKPLIPVTGVISGGPGGKSEEKKLKERYPTMK